MTVRTINVKQFLEELKSQGMPSQEHLAFVCPMCRSVQSAQDLIDAGAGGSFKDVEKYLAFSCVGRWRDAPAPRRKPDGSPCNWTLGGLFQTHELVVIDEDGNEHPRFELASPEQAQLHLEERKQ